MKNNFTKIYTNKNAYSILAAKLHDKGTKKIMFGVFIQDNNGCLSEMITINKRSLNSKNPFDCLLDYEGDFDSDDLANIWENIKNQNSTLHTINSSSKTPIETLYSILCDYVHNNLNLYNISFSDGYCNIKTKLFDSIVSGYGYSGLEVKKLFKSLGLLRTNKDRPYDFSIANKECKPERYISFKDITIDMVPTDGINSCSVNKNWFENLETIDGGLYDN